MKRTGMKPRTVPLRRSPFTRRPSELGLRKPGRRKVSPELRAAKDAVKARSGGVCEVQLADRCIPCAAPNFHHRKDLSIGGSDSSANGLAACGSGTTGCHGWITDNPAGAWAKGRWSLKSWEDPATMPVLYRGRWVLLPVDGGEPVPTSAPAVAS